MISEYACFENNGLKIEANWNESVKPSEKFKFTIGGKSVIIDRAHLYQTLMLFGDDDQQESLIPVIETKIKEVTRLLKVKARRDIKRGEVIAVPYTTFVPLGTYEKLRLTPLSEERLSAVVNHNNLT